MSLLNDRFSSLQKILKSYPSLLVAYSGGVDSTFLLKAACDVLPGKVRGIIGISPSLAQRELDEAQEVARAFSLPVSTLNTAEMSDENYVSNPHNRCYFCKQELFSEIFDFANTEGFAVIADGTNSDDIGGHRPGLRAARELSVRSPLQEAGLTKSQIRQLSRQLGLPTWNKAEMACLSSRFPTGQRITPAGLRQVELAEDFLRDRGFAQVRVRHHQRLASVEVEHSEITRLNSEPMRHQTDLFLKSLGFDEIVINPEGYRRGRLSEGSWEEK